MDRISPAATSAEDLVQIVRRLRRAGESVTTRWPSATRSAWPDRHLRHCQRPGSQRPQHRKSGELHPDRCGHQLWQPGGALLNLRELIGINTAIPAPAATSASASPSRPMVRDLRAYHGGPRCGQLGILAPSSHHEPPRPSAGNSDGCLRQQNMLDSLPPHQGDIIISTMAKSYPLLRRAACQNRHHGAVNGSHRPHP